LLAPAGFKKQRKPFFFEKKKQKTFMTVVLALT
jgi:hypothetical protein